MGYQSYLIERFDTTHENIFFRELNKVFENAFANVAGKHILVGNLSVGGHALDAIFIKKGAIIVIDFKDYEGKLTFSENGPWKIQKEDEFIFVAGGAVSRNPFQQVKAYRFSLYPLLSDKENEILDANHSVEWSHTNAMVLFQRPIEFDLNEIPAKIQRFFHITDANNVVNRINDCFSSQLNLTDREIDNILKILNVEQDSLFDSKATTDEQTVGKKFDVVRMERIKQLIPKVQDADISIRAIAFYYTMIAIERINESSVSDVHDYSLEGINWNGEPYYINIESHPKFYQVFTTNRNQKFPKNLFVSINLMMDNRIVPLFYTIIVNSEIENLSRIPVDFNDFVLFRLILSELNLTEDAIEELSTLVQEGKNLEEKIAVVRNYLGVSLELTSTISLGLSAESIYTSQLQSELNQFIKGRVPIEGSLFKSFISNDKLITEKLGPQENLIQITQLNKAQKKAVALSFEQKLTVVTGPPGTGKSQVVSNILANAVITGKKVLFASKNNQAVDNVFQRINDILQTEYFLRLGSNEHIVEAITAIDVTIQQKRKGTIPNQESQLIDCKQKLADTINVLNKLNEDLDAIPVLIKREIALSDKLQACTNDYENWLTNLTVGEKELFVNNTNEIDISNGDINSLRSGLKNGLRGGLNGLIFSIFMRKLYIQKIKALNEQLPKDVQKFIDSSAPYFSNDANIVNGLLLNIDFIQNLAKKQKEISADKAFHQDNFDTITVELNDVSSKLTQLRKDEQNIKEQINSIEQLLPSLGIELLKLSINEAMRLGKMECMEEYKAVISNPKGVPWKNEEQNEFHIITEEFLKIFKAISLTNLTVKKSFLLNSEIFDLVVIDEASQCDIASALPLLYRAKNAVIIGDPLQLPHITSISKQEQEFVLEKLNLPKSKFNYVDNSLFHLSDSLSGRSGFDSSFLEEHYRCHPDIINFSNIYFYQRIAGNELKIKTKKNQFHFGDTGLNWVNTVGRTDQNRNVNEFEVDCCLNLAIELHKKHPDASIGIVTPFKHQKEAILKGLNSIQNNANIICDTVHRYQGDEKDIMIFSLVLGPDSKPSLARFINIYSPYVLNVAVTRARSALYIVGDKNYCKTLQDKKGKSLLCNLADYADNEAFNN